jgi:hypothetical protein
MRRFMAVLILSGLVAAAVAAGTASSASQATVIRVKQYSAGALAFFGDCADPVNQPVGAVCHETFVILFRDVVADRGSIAPSQSPPWAFYATTYTMTYVAPPPADPVISNQVEGVVLDPSFVSSDREHLSTASVAATVPMNDGSTFAFRGTWTATSKTIVYGNDGPDAGGPRHFVDKCATQNTNAHEKNRFATMTGTVDGHPVRTYDTLPDAGVIFFAHFVYIDSTHGGCS